jgi:hypothetical protein
MCPRWRIFFLKNKKKIRTHTHTNSQRWKQNRPFLVWAYDWREREREISWWSSDEAKLSCRSMCGFCRRSEREEEREKGTTIVNRLEVEAKHGRSRRRRTPSPKIKSAPLTNLLVCLPSARPPGPLTRDVKSTTTCRTWIWVGWPPPPKPPPFPSPFTRALELSVQVSFTNTQTGGAGHFFYDYKNMGIQNRVICSCDMTLNLWTF